MLRCKLRREVGCGYGAHEFISARPESLRNWLAGAEIRNDSAGKKGGLIARPPFFVPSTFHGAVSASLPGQYCISGRGPTCTRLGRSPRSGSASGKSPGTTVSFAATRTQEHPAPWLKCRPQRQTSRVSTSCSPPIRSMANLTRWRDAGRQNRLPAIFYAALTLNLPKSGIHSRGYRFRLQLHAARPA